MDVELLLRYVISPGLFTSALLGILVGALYGFQTIGEAKLSFPIALWTVGLAFVVSLGILAATEETPITLEASVARGLLWTILCLAIPVGRGIRIRFERWRIRRATKKLEE